MITAILSFSAIFIYSVMSQKQWWGGSGRLLSVHSDIAVSSALCSNLRTRSQSQAQEGASRGLVVEVRLNKTVRFSLVGGGWGCTAGVDWVKTTGGAEEDWSPRRSLADEGRAGAAERNVYRAFYTKDAPHLCSSCQIWSQLFWAPLAAPAGVLRGISRAPRQLRCSPLNSGGDAPDPCFLTVAVSDSHRAERVGECLNNQANPVNFFFLLFFGGKATRCELSFSSAGGESIGKHEKTGEVKGAERCSGTWNALRQNAVGWEKLVECASEFNQLWRSHHHGTQSGRVGAWGRRKEKRRQCKEGMFLFAARQGGCVQQRLHALMFAGA